MTFRRASLSPLTVLPSLLALVSGCVVQMESPPPAEVSDTEDDRILVVHEGALRDVFAEGDAEGWLRGPELTVMPNANRVGIQFDADGVFAAQLRTSTDDAGDTWGAWQDVPVVYAEPPLFNAHVDITPGTARVQLRALVPIETRFSYLAVDAFEHRPAQGGVGVEQADVDQGLAADGIVVTRSAWGARSVRCSGAQSPTRITVHHTDTPNTDTSVEARIRQVQSYHIDTRGWCDIGYHFLVGKDGRVYQGRAENVVGAHAAGANTNNVGVSYVGDFDSAAVPQVMLTAGARIIRALSRTYGIPLNRTNLKGHREVGTTSTACPGDRLFPLLPELIRLAQTGGTSTSSSAAASSTSTGSSSGGSSSGGVSSSAAASSSSSTGGFSSSAAASSSSGASASASSSTGGTSSSAAASSSSSAASTTSNAASSSSSTGGTLTGPYTDVPSNHPAFEATRALRARGVMWGCAAGRFCPDDTITRAELASVLGGLMSAAFTVPTRATFTDVPRTHDAFAGVEEVAARGVITACASRRFCPDDPVTRAGAAVFVRRARGLANVPSSAVPSFTDVQGSHWAFGGVEALFRAGHVSGCSASPRRYCPDDGMTRAQAAVVMARAFGLVTP